jgi:SAM-dependent methyltransferase
MYYCESQINMGILRGLFPKKNDNFKAIKKYVKEKKGLEIGGPSDIFSEKNYIPIYPLASLVDGVNFSTSTIWESTIHEGDTYRYDINKKTGYQYIADGTDLSIIGNEQYDFILSSHNLEHIANPIKALKEWLRVLRPNGMVLAILPDKQFTFDHKRPTTTFEHIMEDYHSNTLEDDLTHLDEILALHDLDRDPGVIDRNLFPARCSNNFNNRCLHQHVFDMELLRKIFDYLELEIILTDAGSNLHQVIAGVKI